MYKEICDLFKIQSDSDDISGAQQQIPFALLSKHLMNLESDSVNENLTPGRPFTRRLNSNLPFL